MIQTQKPKGDRSLYTTPFEKKVLFFLVSMGIIGLTYGILSVFDFLPEKPDTEEVVSTTTTESIEEYEEIVEPLLEERIVDDPLPVSIYFDAWKREVAVLNPTAKDVASLDAALLKGVVRHPDSADFKDEGTIFLFGHSSYLPTVKNKNYQAFNGLQDLKWGDVVRLRSGEAEYIYRVDSVEKASATNAAVDIERGESKLVLVTCNTFGAKDDRYIVEATLIDIREFRTVENS